MNPETEVFFENVISYSFILLLIIFIVFFYLRKKKKSSDAVSEKIKKAIETGFFEPHSLHPVVDQDICIGSGGCIAACPEKDILGIVNGRATTINASRCVGHGACFHACPVEAITLVMGTEKRGVELPHISQTFETNVEGIYIAGELGGMGLIKNAVEQGKQAVENILNKHGKKGEEGIFDIFVIGAGPAGISATLNSKKLGLSYKTVEQDSIGGTVFSFPRQKVVMTSSMELPFYGKVKLSETSKTELITIWNEAITKGGIEIAEGEKVEKITPVNKIFEIETNKNKYKSNTVLLSIGRRGSPRKLGIEGEKSEKVFYRLLEPELIKNQDIIVVGGGDSAIENALMLSDEGNNVTISYRGESFKRIKPKNLEKVEKYSESGKLEIAYNTTLKKIMPESVEISGPNGEYKLRNDIVYIFAGGELPNKFLERTGITITKKFGEAVLKHQN